MSSVKPNTSTAVLEHDQVADNATGYIASFSTKESPVLRLKKFLHSYPVAAPTIVLLLAIFGFSLLIGNRFLHPFNLSLILQQVTIIGVIGVAQTLIILTAGIDLSVGAIMVLCSVVMGRMAIDLGLDAWFALALGISVGALAGFINGLLITRLKIPPFIATLGSWNVFFALNLWYSKSETIRSQDISAAAPLLQWTGETINFFGARLTYGSLLMLGIFFIIWFALNWTAWGRHVYATGDDPDAARLAGIQTNRILMSVYVLAGVVCAVGAWVLIGRIGSVSPQAGYTANLDSITAVVIGGCSLFGGRGSIYGTLIGALVVGVFRNGLALAGVDVLWQEFTVGILIISAVGVDQWIRRGTV